MMVALVILVTSGALIVGALWGLYGRMPAWLEGMLVAVAGGALIVSLMSELVEPALQQAGLLAVAASVAAGATVFTVADWWIDERWGDTGGAGLLAAITLDGIPENLALGVALIGAEPLQVAALAGSILLSNLPEAAGGAHRMQQSHGHARPKILGLWSATAGLLSLAALGGHLLLDGVAPHLLALIRCFAAGAVVASLATEVFPQAFRETRQWTGLAVTTGLLLGLALSELGG